MQNYRSGWRTPSTLLHIFTRKHIGLLMNVAFTRSTRFIFFLIIFVCQSAFFSCEPLQNSPKYQFAEGYYSSRVFHKKVKRIYLVPGGDSIKIYSAKRLNEHLDTTESLKIAFPLRSRPDSFATYSYIKSSFDFDVLNLLFKFRPSVHGFPPQFNNNILNAAFYIGRRVDVYKLRYTKSPLGVYNRDVAHYGYSLGAFTGFGGARIDEYVTQNAITIQYDGVVNLSGVAAVLAMDKVNFGLNIGFDHLLDRNNNVWIYQGRPWLGVSVGLNLN